MAKLNEVFVVKEGPVPPEADKEIRKMLEDTIHIAESKLVTKYGYSMRSDTVKIVKNITMQILQQIEHEAK